MSRQPKQVHIYLYRKNLFGIDEFAIFQRADNELWWQGICGRESGLALLEVRNSNKKLTTVLFTLEQEIYYYEKDI